MFPRSVLTQIDNETPKINPDIANGLVIKHLKHVEDYVDSIIKSAAQGFPAGLKYDGCRRTTPIEEFREATKIKSNRSVFDVSKSDLYLMEYNFSFMGEKLPPIYMYLPYVTTAGTIYLSGARYVISPVLADRVISITPTSVFVRLLKARLMFNRDPYYFLASEVRENVQIAYSLLYNKKAISGVNNKPSVKAQCTLIHYLFCKYGFKETFKRFLNIEPIVGYDEINTDNYNPDEWVICSSLKIPPKNYGKRIYEASNIKLAIRKEEYTTNVKNYVGGFFYIVDHFPQRIKIEYLDNTRLWMTLLGLLIWSDSVSEGKLHSDINDHILSLDEYIDLLVKDKLLAIGYQINDIYELFALVINKFDEWLLSSNDKVNTMYDKELSVLYYVCYNIIEAIFSLYFNLKASQRKAPDVKDIKNKMTKYLKPGTIYKLTRLHGEVSTTSTSGDNKFFRLTCMLVPQTSTNKARSRDKKSTTDQAKRLHASIAEIGSFCALPKSAPDG